MLDKIFIKQKIELIIRNLERLNEFHDLTIDEVAKDPYKYAALKNFLMEIIGRGIDINQHIIAESPDLKEKTPEYRETFLRLGGLKILPKKFAEKIAASAGFRNAIVHDYDDVDENMVYKTVDEAIEQYTKYCDYIIKFLDKQKR
jgi:uncharacterized protein YutE (UPF0331/DUF86 family)